MTLGPCTVAPGGCLRRDGYVQVWHQGAHWYAHRLAWTLERGPIPDGLCVLHHCDNRACICLEHLYLGTDADNARDREQRNRRHQWGVLSGMARLTAEDVREVRRLASLGRPQRKIARDYGVCQRTIVKIVHRISYIEVE